MESSIAGRSRVPVAVNAIRKHINHKKEEIQHLETLVQELSILRCVTPSQDDSTEVGVGVGVPNASTLSRISTICTRLLDWSEDILSQLYDAAFQWNIERTDAYSKPLWPSVGRSISDVLWKELFTPILVGESPGRCELVADLCKGVSLMYSPEGATTLLVTFNCVSNIPLDVKKWRSILFRTYMESDRYRDGLKVKCAHFQLQINEIMERAGCDDSVYRATKLQEFQKEICDPIIELITQLLCSGEAFRWFWLSSDEDPELALGRFECVDSETLSPVSRERIPRLAKNQIRPIFPGLAQGGSDSNPGDIIKKGYALVDTPQREVKLEW